MFNLWIFYITLSASETKYSVICAEGWCGDLLQVGIVGRTGAGKSSLISALFRLARLEGTVRIDNMDTAVLSLSDLRSHISIIPQEPVLFTATLRDNLDPFHEFPDDVLWRALEDVSCTMGFSFIAL
jgi:ATP-binding cassette subfamily C (CFTR/MRP) protein 4